MLAIKPDVRLAQAEGIMVQAIPEIDHYYAFSIMGGDQFKLNYTAYWVLGAIGNGVNFQTLLDEFAQNFDLEEEKAKEDLAEVIQFALENNIIKEIDHEDYEEDREIREA
jgi:hypothetical protein